MNVRETFRVVRCAPPHDSRFNVVSDKPDGCLDFTHYGTQETREYAEHLCGLLQAGADAQRSSARDFDRAIATLDRGLSEIMNQAKMEQDAADTATLRHHAGDMLLAGIAILRRLGREDDLLEYVPSAELRERVTALCAGVMKA